jgi:hypothetical protein
MPAARALMIALALSLGLAVAGCGGPPRFDATNDDTAKASVDRMKAGLSEAQRYALAKDMATVAMPALMKQAFSRMGADKGGKIGPAEAMKPLHGLTAAEIHERAEGVRKGLGTAK